MDFSSLDEIIQDSIPVVCPAAQLAVRWRGEFVHHKAYGYLDPGSQSRPTRTDTRFDLASVTKLFTTTVFMILVESGMVSLDDPVSAVLPKFKGKRQIQPYEDPLNPGNFVQVVPPTTGTVDAAQVTFRQLLTHTSGLPAWRPLSRQPDCTGAVQMALDTHFSYPANERVIYSDLGLITLLTYRVYHGRDGAGILQLRRGVHEEVIKQLCS